MVIHCMQQHLRIEDPDPLSAWPFCAPKHDWRMDSGLEDDVFATMLWYEPPDFLPIEPEPKPEHAPEYEYALPQAPPICISPAELLLHKPPAHAASKAASRKRKRYRKSAPPAPLGIATSAIQTGQSLASRVTYKRWCRMFTVSSPPKAPFELTREPLVWCRANYPGGPAHIRTEMHAQLSDFPFVCGKNFVPRPHDGHILCVVDHTGTGAGGAPPPSLRLKDGICEVFTKSKKGDFFYHGQHKLVDGLAFDYSLKECEGIPEMRGAGIKPKATPVCAFVVLKFHAWNDAVFEALHG